MKLYITAGSPYARIARIVILEKGLESRVEIIAAQTRVADSPYYRINPSGRVPYLIRDDGVGLEESAVICAYLDHIDGKPAFDLPAGGEACEARRLEGLARSMVDGLAVWGREIVRPENERSPTIIRHEAHRSERMADLWETEIDHPLMRGPLNPAQITLACGLGLEARNPDLRWRPGHPKLCDWFDGLAARPSFAATAPPRAPLTTVAPPGSDMAHFPELLRELPPFDGPFDAFKLEANDCDVLFASYPAGTVIPPHSHDTENVGVITQGELILTLDGKETRHRPGDWYHVPAKATHAARFDVETSEIEFWFHAPRRGE